MGGATQSERRRQGGRERAPHQKPPSAFFLLLCASLFVSTSPGSLSLCPSTSLFFHLPYTRGGVSSMLHGISTIRAQIFYNTALIDINTKQSGIWSLSPTQLLSFIVIILILVSRSDWCISKGEVSKESQLLACWSHINPKS